MNRAPGSTVLGLVEAGETLIEIEVQTNWDPEQIKELALEEGYEPAGAGSRFQPVAKGGRRTMRSVPTPTLAAAEAFVAAARDETPTLDEPAAVEPEEVTEDEPAPHGRPDETEVPADDEAGTSEGLASPASSSLPETDGGERESAHDDGSGSAETCGPVASPSSETDTGAASAPTGAPAELGTAAFGAAAPVSPTFVPNAEDLLSAAHATGDPVLQGAAVGIEASLSELARMLIEHGTRSDALAEVERLEAERARVIALLDDELQVARIRAGLGTATPSPAPTAVEPERAIVRVSHAGQGGVAGVKRPEGVTDKDIRAWASKVGLHTTPRGRLGDDIVLRYIEAHPQGGAA